MSALRYFKINTGYFKDHDLCMVHHAPNKVRHIDYMLSWGERLGTLYPDTLEDARIYMEPNYGGGLGGLVSNTNQFLIVSGAVKNVMGKFHPDPTALEMLRVIICDHKKRVASDEYWFVNPIGVLDCLDLNKSVIKRSSTSEVISVKSMVLRAGGIDPAKPLFRPKESPSVYIIRHDLLMAIKALNLPIPNIYVEELEVTGAPA